jgi:hypothetical protein
MTSRAVFPRLPKSQSPPGAGCMGGGVPPCGLSAGAFSEPVESGPVHPWGCNWPLLSQASVSRAPHDGR